MAKCSMCRSAKGVWPVTFGGKVCDRCKGTVERCDNQRGAPSPKPVQGCFSRGMRRK